MALSSSRALKVVVPLTGRHALPSISIRSLSAARTCVAQRSRAEELLALAQRKHDELVVAGELDAVADEQPKDAPTMDDTIVGTKLEICWRYWRTPTAAEVVAGEKRKKIGVPIWCEGEVTHLANGTTTTTNPDNIRCKKLANAGAVRIRWPEDLDREVPEPESFTWNILQAANFNKDTHLGWRLTKEELASRRRAREAGGKQ